MSTFKKGDKVRVKSLPLKIHTIIVVDETADNPYLLDTEGGYWYHEDSLTPYAVPTVESPTPDSATLKAPFPKFVMGQTIIGYGRDGEITGIRQFNGVNQYTFDTSFPSNAWFDEDELEAYVSPSESADEIESLKAQLAKAQAEFYAVIDLKNKEIKRHFDKAQKLEADLGEHRVERLALLNKVETLEFDDKIKADSIDNLHNENVKLKADLVAAQNIIVQAGKDFEALKMQNIRYEATLENIYNNTFGYEAGDSDADQDLIDGINRDTNLVLAHILSPSPAQEVTVKCLNCGNPVSHDFCDTKCYQEYKHNQEKLITLSEREIEWLAKHVSSASPDRYYSKEAAEGNWRKTPSAVNRVVSLSGTGITYALSPEYDTPANRTAIAAKRAELGLA